MCINHSIVYQECSMQHATETLDQKLLRNVEVLYGGSCQDGNMIKEANAWLVAFQETDESFLVCYTILQQSLSSPVPLPLLYYASHTLLLAVRYKKRIHQENPTQISIHLQKEEENIIQLTVLFISKYKASDYQSIHLKLFQVIAAQWMHSKLPFKDYLKKLSHFCLCGIDRITPSNIGSVPESSCVCLLGALEMIPEEINRSNISLTERNTMNDYLRCEKEFLMNVCYSSFSSSSISVRLHALLTIKSWNITLVQSRVLLQNNVYQAIWNCLFTPALFSTACSMLTDFLSRPFGALALRAGSHILSMKDLFQSAVREGNEEVYTGITWMISAFAADNVHNLVRESFCAPFSDFMQLVLIHPSKKIALNALSFYEKLAMFYKAGKEGKMPDSLFSVPLAHILLHLRTKPRLISKESEDGLLVLARLPEKQLEGIEDYYSEEVEDYMDFYKEASKVLYSFAKTQEESFYMLLLDAVASDNQWVETAIIGCIACCVDKQKEESGCPSVYLEKLCAMAFSGTIPFAHAMLFLGKHAKWMRSHPSVFQLSVQYLVTAPAGSLDILSSNAIAFALQQIILYHKKAFEDDVPVATAVIQQLHGMVSHIANEYKASWTESLIMLARTLPVALFAQYIPQSFDKPWSSMIQQNQNKELLLHLQIARASCKALESEQRTEYLSVIQSTLTLFIRSIIEDWGVSLIKCPIEEDTWNGLFVLLNDAIFGAGCELVSFLLPLVQFLHAAFSSSHLSSILKTFSICFRQYLSEENAETFCQLLWSITESVASWLSQQGIDGHFSVVEAFFNILGQVVTNKAVLDRYIFTSERIHLLMEISVSTLRCNEPDSIRRVLEFLLPIITHVPELHQLPRVKEIFQAILHCVSSLYQKTVVQRSGGLVLFAYVSRMDTSHLIHWIREVAITWKDSSKLKPVEIEQISQLLCTVRPKMRYRALIIDISKICSGQMTTDVLLGYEL